MNSMDNPQAGFFGFQNESPYKTVIASLWFVLGLMQSRRYVRMIQELEEHERRVHWRKLAGMVRSVVKSELRYSPQTRKNTSVAFEQEGV